MLFNVCFVLLVICFLTVMEMVLDHSEHGSILGPKVVIEPCGYFTSLDSEITRSSMQYKSSEMAGSVAHLY